MKTLTLRLLAIFAAFALCAGLRAQEVWEQVFSSTNQNLWGVCQGGGKFVAVGENGNIMTSVDGRAWTAQNSTTIRWLLSVTYSPDLKLYVAVGDAGTILSSPDAITWTLRSSTGARLNGVLYAVDRFVAVGESGTVRTSVDGANWVTGGISYAPGVSVPSDGTFPLSNWLHGLVFARGTWRASGKGGSVPYSVDGTNLRYQPAGPKTDFESIAFGRETFLAVGGGGQAVTTRAFVGGPNTIPPAWTIQSTGTTVDLRAVTYAHNTFVVGASDGSLYVTPDGSTGWRRVAKPTSQVINALASDATCFVSVGFGGTILRSPVAINAPTVLTAPTNQTATVGDNAALRAGFTGDGLTYRWSVNGVDLPEATTDTLFLSNVTLAASGTYTVVATNPAGSASASATLEVSANGSSILDTSFVASPEPTLAPRTMVPLSDGKILIGGNFTYLIGGTPILGLARLNPDGSFDSSFRVTTGLDGAGTINSIAVQTDGRILIAGKFSSYNGTPIANLARLFADGSLDASFAPSATDVSLAGDSTGVTQILLQPDGKILVATTFKPLVRLLPLSGAADSTFVQNSSSRVLPPSSTPIYPRTIALDASGRIVAGDTRGVYRLLSDGTPDTSIPPYTVFANNAGVSYPVIQADGKILIFSQAASALSITRIVPESFAADPAFSKAPALLLTASTVACAVVNSDARIWVAASYNTNGVLRTGLCRLNSDGSLDLTFNPPNGGFDKSDLSAVALQADGKLLVAGSFTTVGGTAQRKLARIYANATGPLVPTILSPGPDVTRINFGDTTQITPLVVGNGPYTYTWRDTATDSLIYSSASGQPFTLDGDRSLYLTVTGPGGTVLGSAIKGVSVAVAPRITLPNGFSTNIAVSSSRSLALGPIITAKGPFTMQWFRDGNPIAGATTSPINFSGTNLVSGTYVLVVTNAVGQTSSPPITITVDTGGTLVNLSTRANIQTGDNVLIAGFVIDGNDNKRLLIRGIGATLGLPQYGLSGVNLPDPELTLYDSAGKVLNIARDQPTDAGQINDLEVARRNTGAFSIGDGRDAAMLVTLRPGLYSAKVSGTNGATGVGMVEIYENDNLTSRLVNLSARAFVSTGASVVIPGFVVGPGTTRKVLIRGAGPALANYGISNSLADPIVRLVDANGNDVAINDDWQSGSNPAEVADAIAKTQAFAFAPGSKDAALVATLPPGRYSALVSGTNLTTGVALVELYELR